MSFMSMEAINQTFQEMMSNAVKYQIPRFQRNYIWKEELWEDLWSDIETLPKEKYHYMGYTVLSIRYNVICHFSPSEQAQKYNQIAIKVHEKAFKRASLMKNSDLFKNLYPDDKIFFNAFEFYKMPSRQTSKKIRFGSH
ncbi:MAG: hypothetical protein DRQ49_00415 [Gammaproteobacteria bacterium]|nr:MAG: hypothetical protein DRQ49_00415 [Gammaproteobacteria bacterium]RKZ76634.1 MAG: hypothetical protein DRQ57_03180 [Gammaproteobacteria bacterium]